MFLDKLLRRFKFNENLKRITSAVPEEICTFMIISRSILRIMRKFSDRRYREDKDNTFYVG
jgi:hypothetical protein